MSDTQIRDSKGRWAEGNPLRFQPGDPRTERAASTGGQRRAERLTPERRTEIGRMGMRALVEKRFKGDKQRALAWMGSHGAFASDAGYREIGIGVFPKPEPLPEAE